MMLAAFAFCRLVAYVSAILLFGAAAMLAMSGSRGLSLSVEAILRKMLRGMAVVGALAALCLLPLQTATIADAWRGMWDVDMLSVVAFQTRYGQAWMLRAMATLLVAAVFLWASPAKAGLRAVVAGIALLPLGLSGHAAMNEGWPGFAHAASDAVHCLAAGFWLGSLPVFLAFLKLWNEPALKKDATRALLRFSTVGHIAVAALLLTGALNALMILWPAGWDLQSSYPQLLAIKILLALAMVALAVVNRYRWIPALRTRRGAALTHIRRNTVLELWLGGGVIALVSLLGLLSPQ